ncbi:TRAP transporter large permease subunit [Alkalihalobacillus sp. MEB130]|uniref:TRAP transporter large permease n=1 Tax=Alkalihalobacillus sp. MEB130 TaxID=2976704 RepID=UPI0028DD4415|nr:TRAP transporter large permease subunit [Alkalihalobacillus sp. MEB130]MDT8862967.1 TRAP transporter large permease subunit [Alkalihalobacillus sp. MEB130]
MASGLLALLIFGSLLLFLLLGVPVAFAMGGISLIIGFFFWSGEASIVGFVLGSYGRVLEFTLTALPMYILMAGILRYSDLADDLYEAIYRWFGGIKGGLAAGTTLIGALFGAMVGIATVATATLGVTARPSMLKRGYDSRLVSGVILAGGALGILIPPSILMIIYAMEASVSAGRLFFAGLIPGLLAAIIFMGYAIIISYIKPEMGPALPKESRFSWKEKFQSLKGVILPLLVIIMVLASIFTGLATPTEAAAVGVIGSFICAGIKRKLTWSNIKKMVVMSVKLNGMVFWLLIGAVAYARIVSATGVGTWVANLITDFDVNRWVILIGMQVIFFILGMFIDPGAILLMTAPVFMPMVIDLGFDPIWYGVLFILNACMAYLTPPFGISLFVLKGVAPDIKMQELYRSVIPFVILYAIVIIIVMIFPQLVHWLPDRIMG